MPSRWTFSIKPIKELISFYANRADNWIDPFAGRYSPAEFTNDLNPKSRATSHLPAVEFISNLAGEFSGVLFDPPYSLRQLKECYDKFGIKMFQDDSQRFPQNVKELIAPKIKKNGTAITCGWNSQGFGKNLGFKLIEILLVCHGRGHNDTIVTVERKF